MASDVVMTARNAALEPWWHTYTDEDRDRARACLDRMGVGRFADEDEVAGVVASSPISTVRRSGMTCTSSCEMRPMQ